MFIYQMLDTFVMVSSTCVSECMKQEMQFASVSAQPVLMVWLRLSVALLLIPLHRNQVFNSGYVVQGGHGCTAWESVGRVISLLSLLTFACFLTEFHWFWYSFYHLVKARGIAMLCRI